MAPLVDFVEVHVNEAVEMADVALTTGVVGELGLHEPRDHGDTAIAVARIDNAGSVETLNDPTKDPTFPRLYRSQGNARPGGDGWD